MSGNFSFNWTTRKIGGQRDKIRKKKGYEDYNDKIFIKTRKIWHTPNCYTSFFSPKSLVTYTLIGRMILFEKFSQFLYKRSALFDVGVT
jgi:hypothetical protein